MTRVHLCVSMTATPSCALSPMDQRQLTLGVCTTFYPLTIPTCRAPTKHHHHLPWACIALQLPPTSLCPFRGNHLHRLPYLWPLIFKFFVYSLGKFNPYVSQPLYTEMFLREYLTFPIPRTFPHLLLPVFYIAASLPTL